MAEIKNNEVEGNKAAEQEPKQPTKKDKSKLDPVDSPEANTNPEKNAGKAQQEKGSEHPKLELDSSKQGTENSEKNTPQSENGKLTAEAPPQQEPQARETNPGAKADGNPASEGDVKKADGNAANEGNAKKVDSASTNEGDGKKADGNAANEGDAKKVDGNAANEGDAKKADGNATNEGDAKKADGNAANEGDAKKADGNAADEGGTKKADGNAADEGDAKKADGNAADEGDTKKADGNAVDEGDAKKADGAAANEGDAKKADGNAVDEGDVKKADGNAANEGDANKNLQTDYPANSRVNTPEGRAYTDDNGKPYMHYHADGKQWKLDPNTEYRSNGYDYKTDDKGRISHVEGDLRLKDGDRSALNAQVEDMKPGDDRGHIIGDQFDGSNKIDNLAPQASNVNRGEFKAHENQLAKALDEGKPVHVSYDLSYADDLKRPNGLIADYTIGNDRNVRIFEN